MPHACLIDLGIAKSGFLDGITLPGATLGTPGFLSPEQIQDAPSVDHRTDLFALGCILHLLLTGGAVRGNRSPCRGVGSRRRPVRDAAAEVPEWLLS